MKYTKKQLNDAYLAWSIDTRLAPNSFKSVEDVVSMDVEDYSKDCVKTLLSYIK